MARPTIASGVVHRLPPDWRQVLAADPAARDSWNNLTPLARNEWICWIISPKRPQTRQNHIGRARQELIDGKRRPCCWAGCRHRPAKP